MIGFGLRTMVINADTIAQARTTQQNLWLEARTDPDVILLSPEELGSRECFHLLNNHSFTARMCILGIDELHLLYWWGKSFRPAFQQIGVIRARLPLRDGRQIPIIGISATLREGPLGIITGNPGVSQANPDPTREDPYPWATGRGFAGRGQGFSRFLQVQITYFYIFKSYSPALLVISLPSCPLLFIRVITLSRYIILSW